MLYFIQSGTKIKIGRGNASARFRTINTASPHPCRLLLAMHVRDECAAERALHQHLKEHRCNGEWFEIDFAAAFRALVELKLMPEHQCPPRETALPAGPPMHVRFADWFLATHARDWHAEAVEHAKVHIAKHWVRHQREFTARLREHGGNVDDMIYMAQPVSYDEALTLLASLRQKFLQQK